MKKRSAYSKAGKSALSGQKVSITKKGVSKVYQSPPEQITLEDGTKLNIPESKIYRALEKLKVNFSSQVPLHGGRVMGGALCDFILWDYRINLEYQGPFHEAEADFWRKVAREKSRFIVEYLYERDLINIYKRLRQIMGMGA